jgi:hypothetical protein
MIKTAIRDEFARALNVELAKPEYRPMISDARSEMAGEAIRKIVTENAGQMMASMVGSMIQQTMYQMQSNLPRY